MPRVSYCYTVALFISHIFLSKVSVILDDWLSRSSQQAAAGLVEIDQFCTWAATRCIFFSHFRMLS